MGLKVDVNFQLSTWNDEKRESLKLWFQKNKKNTFYWKEWTIEWKWKQFLSQTQLKAKAKKYFQPIVDQHGWRKFESRSVELSAGIEPQQHRVWIKDKVWPKVSLTDLESRIE